MQKEERTIAYPRNVFSGPDAIKDFLNPEKNPPLPLVELPEHLNPYHKDGVRIFAKLMNFLPLANVKSLPAYNMLLEHEKRGGLRDVTSLVENSSGNTVFSLAVIGRIFGIPKTKAFVSHEVMWGKLQLLRFFGVEVIVNEEPICPDPADATSGIYKAKQMGKRKGWFNPGQYDNSANPAAHEKWTGPQIWEQTNGKLSIFCAGLGTTGTMTGISGYLKGKNPEITTVGVTRSLNNPVPGVRTPSLLRQIAFGWEDATDHVEEVGTKDSFKKSVDLCRSGIVVGPSSGFAFHGLLQFIAIQKEGGLLEKFRNVEGEVFAVFVCPDSPFPYLNEYFEYLDDSHFPKVENEKLLINRPGNEKRKRAAASPASVDFEIDPDDACRMIYPIAPKEIWQRLEMGRKVPMNRGVIVIDVRSRGEFLHFHLPGSECMDIHRIVEDVSKLSKHWKGKKICLVCSMGIRTMAVVGILRKKKIEAYSIRGGVTEWSARNLPRWRPNVCKS